MPQPVSHAADVAPRLARHQITRVLAQSVRRLAHPPSGNDNYQTAQPAELAIVTHQLAAGVAELRDEIVDTWRQSDQVAVGFPLVRVSDIGSHAVPMTTTTLGAD